jgi:hypothetical protein
MALFMLVLPLATNIKASNTIATHKAVTAVNAHPAHAPATLIKNFISTGNVKEAICC